MNIFDPTTLVGLHSLLSVVAMAAGIPVLMGLLRGQGRPRWTLVFLATAVATNVTGFALPASGFLPSHGVGVLSSIALGAAIAARYRFHLAGAWRRVYAVGMVAAEYFLGVRRHRAGLPEGARPCPRRGGIANTVCHHAAGDAGGVRPDRLGVRAAPRASAGAT